jgi:hypothetical protein
MKNFLYVFVLTFFGISAQAQNTPLACQVEAAAGLGWDKGRWETKKFIDDRKFILIKQGKTLSNDSVAKAFSSPNAEIFCKVSAANASRVVCTDLFGSQIHFDTGLLKGSISFTFGATMTGDKYKDTLSIEAFSCQPF